jgi:hypothetical protein
MRSLSWFAPVSNAAPGGRNQVYQAWSEFFDRGKRSFASPNFPVQQGSAPSIYQFGAGGVISLPIVATEDGVLPVGVGVPTEVSVPAVGSIANADTLAD